MPRDLIALKHLRRVVENAPEELFHMRSIVEQAECGTARCALGWCLVDPWFQQNTRLGEVATWDQAYAPLPPDAEAQSYAPAVVRAKFAGDIFGISPNQAGTLFAFEIRSGADPHPISREQVIKNIDRLIKGRPAVAYPGVPKAYY
jgi:hypothetical protein